MYLETRLTNLKDECVISCEPDDLVNSLSTKLNQYPFNLQSECRLLTKPPSITDIM